MTDLVKVENIVNNWIHNNFETPTKTHVTAVIENESDLGELDEDIEFELPEASIILSVLVNETLIMKYIDNLAYDCDICGYGHAAAVADTEESIEFEKPRFSKIALHYIVCFDCIDAIFARRKIKRIL